MQAYGISDKAKDVRGLVMRLNSERGDRLAAAAGLAAAEPPLEAQGDPQAAPPAPKPAPWQDFLDEQVSCVCCNTSELANP